MLKPLKSLPGFLFALTASIAVHAELPKLFDEVKPIASYSDNVGYLMTIGGWYCDPVDHPAQAAAGEQVIALAELLSEYTRVDFHIDPGCETWVQERVKESKNLTFHITRSRSVWIRDFGPFWIQPTESELPVILDLPYIPQKNLLEDSFPTVLATKLRLGKVTFPMNKYDLQGGNFLVDKHGNCFLTDLNRQEKRATYNELLTWMGCKKNVFIASIPDDITRHVDMILSITPNDIAFMTHFADERDKESQKIMEGNYSIMRGLGYKVIPVPHAHPVLPTLPISDDDKMDSTIYKSYVNTIVVGQDVFVPQYDDILDSKVLQVFENAGFNAHPVDAGKLIRMEGSLHCVVNELKPH